jgi:hypothetical protein
LTALYGDSPERVFREFTEHLNRLLHTTITDTPLILLANQANTALLEFWQAGEKRCARVGGPYHFFIGQTLRAEEIKVDGARQYQLRTLRYAYRVTEGPAFGSPWILRWEYESRDISAHAHPRHHFHLNTAMSCFEGRHTLNLSDLHMPSGWITIEEVIRFLIHELGIKPKNGDWDRILQESEERFREWTGRTI